MSNYRVVESGEMVVKIYYEIRAGVLRRVVGHEDRPGCSCEYCRRRDTELKKERGTKFPTIQENQV